MIKKKYLYVIIIILVLCILGIINIPLLQGFYCNSTNQGKMYFRFGIVSIPLNFNVCSQE